MKSAVNNKKTKEGIFFFLKKKGKGLKTKGKKGG